MEEGGSRKYWTAAHLSRIEQATSFPELGKVALEVLQSMPYKIIGQVCGPISSGGLNDPNANLHLFDETIKAIEQRNGEVIFHQTVMEETIVRLREELQAQPIEVLEGIYRPLFKSGRMTDLYFINGWESSYGSNWERKAGKEYGMRIWDLDQKFLQNGIMKPAP